MPKIIRMSSGVLRVARGCCGAKAPPLTTRLTPPDCRSAKPRASAFYFGPVSAFMVSFAPPRRGLRTLLCACPRHSCTTPAHRLYVHA